MFRKKTKKMELIMNTNIRNTTYSTRKRGLLKKAMEISMLCAQNIFMVMFDPTKNKIVIYRSSNDLDSTKIDDLFNGAHMRTAHVEYYTDDNYDQMDLKNSQN